MYKDIILEAVYMFYPEEIKSNPVGKWKECVKAMDSNLRESRKSYNFNKEKTNVVNVLSSAK